MSEQIAEDQITICPPPKVLIVMCTHNGADWLAAQLESFAAQDMDDWALWVSDNGSDDESCDLIREFAKRHRVVLRHRPPHKRRAPARAAASNFMHTLVLDDLPLGPDTYVAISDQDDIWLPDKLSHALGALAQAQGQSSIYGGQSLHVNDEGEEVGHSNLPRRAAGLQNALVQNVVSGHSILLSPRAMQTVRAAGVPAGIWYHDWWLYLLISATGGQVIVDRHIGLHYRQHHGNVMGASRGIRARLKRLSQFIGGEYQRWMRANLKALTLSDVTLTPEAGRALAHLKADQNGTTAGLSGLWRSGVYRQHWLGTCCIYLSGLANKL